MATLTTGIVSASMTLLYVIIQIDALIVGGMSFFILSILALAALLTIYFTDGSEFELKVTKK